MTLSEIIANLTKLTASLRPGEFIYDFLTAFGTPKATISRLRSGDVNLAKNHGCTLLKLVFYSTKTIVIDYQRLTEATNGLGTTFPLSWVFGSFLLP